MKKVFLWLWLLIKSQLKSPVMMGFIIAMPLAGFIVSATMSASDTNVVRVGLVSSFSSDGVEDEVAKDTIERLIKGDYTVKFYKVASKDELVKDISDGNAKLGYVFANDFSKRLDSDNYKDSIILVKPSGDLISSITNEVVFSELFRVYAIDIAKNYIETSEIFEKIRQEALVTISDMYEMYGDGDDTFSLKLEALSGNESSNLENKSVKAFPIRGVLAVLVLVAGIYGGVWWLNDKSKGVFLALPRNVAGVSRVLYAFVPTFLFAVSVEFTLILTKSATYPFEFIKMFLYVIAITVFVTLLTFVIKSDKLMVSIIPVIAICSLVFCPIFFNLEIVVPQVKYINRLLLTYYYLM